MQKSRPQMTKNVNVDAKRKLKRVIMFSSLPMNSLGNSVCVNVNHVSMPTVQVLLVTQSQTVLNRSMRKVFNVVLKGHSSRLFNTMSVLITTMRIMMMLKLLIPPLQLLLREIMTSVNIAVCLANGKRWSERNVIKSPQSFCWILELVWI